MELPKHEQLKRDLMDKFTSNSSYLGSHVKLTIQQFDFKTLNDGVQKPKYIKKSDVILVWEGVKRRPAVIIKVLKDRTCIYTPMTSTENIHCLTPFNSRFFGEGCFTKTVSVCTEEFAIENFAGVFDNNRDLNVAIKNLKEFLVDSI